ncbi:MAG: sigma-54-dependent Fis family transcriptional regulator [Burkholderiales bacterium]|nr:sigma-54-dependent Fis family transcriptional regulator [Burkholderiales bacterium]MCW5575483.1 sigma-54-dependent Fis family transcriptional regulator [Burkholderiales bacterium]
MANGQVLVVDDEADIRELLGMTLIRMGLEPQCAGSVSEALSLLGCNTFELCLTDMRLVDGDGLSIVEHITKNHPSLPVAVITAHGSAENAVAALKAGAFDYLGKPVSLDQLRALVRSALKLPRPGAEQQDAAAPPAPGTPCLIGASPQMEQARQMIDKLARSQAPVQIRGESGCGKELAARLIHLNGARRDGPFVAVNCGAIPESLMESEFFGHKKGAFTGAVADHDGFFRAADGGTLFLDEVGDLPLSMQVKLLRAIQEKRVRQVGSTSEEPVDVRIISATHRHLADEVKSGAFRQDLYYRLNVIELRMPALRELREDIPRLAAAILERHAAGGPAPRLSAQAAAALQDYHFPGNVRELENILERAVALTSGSEIGVEDLQLTHERAVVPEADIDGLPLPERLEAIERKAILDALERARYNQTAAAKLLGISFRALRYRIQRLGIRQELDTRP